MKLLFDTRSDFKQGNGCLIISASTISMAAIAVTLVSIGTRPVREKSIITAYETMKKLILALAITGLASCTTPKKEACSSCCKAGDKKEACETPEKGKMATATSLAKKGAAATPQGQALNAANKAATEAKKAQ
jgi:hypothetical protein